MVVIVEESLANRGHGGRSCRRRGPQRLTVLETASRVNGQVDPSKRLREQPSPWSWETKSHGIRNRYPGTNIQIRSC